MRHFLLLITIASSLTACATTPSNVGGNDSADGDYVTGSNIPRRAKKAPTDRVQTYDGTTPTGIPTY